MVVDSVALTIAQPKGLECIVAVQPKARIETLRRSRGKVAGGALEKGMASAARLGTAVASVVAAFQVVFRITNAIVERRLVGSRRAVKHEIVGIFAAKHLARLIAIDGMRARNLDAGIMRTLHGHLAAVIAATRGAAAVAAIVAWRKVVDLMTNAIAGQLRHRGVAAVFRNGSSRTQQTRVAHIQISVGRIFAAKLTTTRAVLTLIRIARGDCITRGGTTITSIPTRLNVEIKITFAIADSWICTADEW
jgi:hypothetical protein